MQKIIPHIWFETQAREAAAFYTGIFKDSQILGDVSLHDTPSGTVHVVMLRLMGQEFQFLSADPLFDRNPSFSYMVACPSVSDVNALWDRLSPGGMALMPLDRYPFCERFGWLQDKYGVSWQIMHDGGATVQPITPCLMFTGKVCGQAEEAMKSLIALFGKGEVIPGHLDRYKAGEEPEKEGSLKYARFRLGTQEFVFMDSAQVHAFTFNEMQSLIISVNSQDEINRYSNALSAVPEAEQCGWVKDRFGISWQIVPKRMDEMMLRGTPEQLARMTKAFLAMKRFDIAVLERAYQGA